MDEKKKKINVYAQSIAPQTDKTHEHWIDEEGFETRREAEYWLKENAKSGTRWRIVTIHVDRVEY